MSRKLLLLLTLLLLILLPVRAEEEQNLLTNGGFEALGADGLPTGWYTDAYINREGVTLYSVTDDAHSGENAVVVENVGLNDARFAQVVAVEPSSVYCLSGWIRADAIPDGGRGANLSISDVYVFSESVFDTMGGWKYVEMYGVTDSDQTRLTVFARVGGYSGESVGVAAFDDVRLTKVELLPAGATAERWYPQKSVQPEQESEAAEPEGNFRLWLAVLSAAYIAMCVGLSRYTQLRSDPSAALRGADSAGKKQSISLLLVCGLGAALLLRVVIALCVTGYQVDVGCFSSWGYSMLEKGPAGFYGLNGDFMLHNEQGANFCDYPPAYLYVMAFNEGVYSLFGGAVSQAFAHKLIPILCDLLGAMLVARIAQEKGLSRRQSAMMALMLALNPAIILNSAAWCQVDSVLSFCLMLVAYLAIRGKWAAVLPVYVLSILIKPQALMMGFLGLAAIVMELVRQRPRRDPAKGKLIFPRIWRDMGVGLLLSLVLALVIILPFSPNQSSPMWLFSLYGETLSSYPYATVNTANLYYLSGGNWDSILQNADMPVMLAFIGLSACAVLYFFLHRKDKKLTLLEPAIALLLVFCVTFGALGVMPYISGEGEAYHLTTGNPWYVHNTEDGYVRELMTDVEGTTCVNVSPVLLLALAVVLLITAALLMLALYSMLRSGKREQLHTGLIEPAILLAFLLAFVFLAFFDTSWGALGVVAMAMAFAVVLPVFIRSGKLELLPLCGAVLFILLYVFGVKMHERYLFPALFLLGMAYAYRRDKRLLLLLVGLSCILFVNEGIILDNSLRLGSASGHLNQDTHAVASLLALGNVLLALWSVKLLVNICADDQPPRLLENADEPQVTVREHESDPCTPFTHRDASAVKWTWRDAALIGAVTLVYSIVTLTTLGSHTAPQTPWKSTNAQEQVIIDLGQRYEDFSMLYYAQVSYSDFTVASSDDGETWPDDRVCWAKMAEGECFRWKYLVPRLTDSSGGFLRDKYGNIVYKSANAFGDVHKMDGRYVCITAQQVGLILNEVIFRDAQGNDIPASIVGVLNANEHSPLYSDPENLLDEQYTLEGEPGWWNSTYFDEIYHARTGFEHLNGTAPYETSHPPLGKVIMSWFIGIFGMTPFGWRFAGALCGILMLPAMYLLAKQLTKRTSMGFAAMMLMALDCMHFTQTRIATIDSFPVLFIILSYFFMLRFMQRDIVRTKITRILPDLALSGFFMGCGVASKWIGVYAGAGLAVLYFWTCLRHLRVGIQCARIKRSGGTYTQAEWDLLEQKDTPAMKRVICLCLWCLLFFVLVPVVIYLLSYVPYFAHKDLASPIEFVKEVIKAQQGMFNYHATPGLGMDHPFYSPWYEWPLMQRPMYYASPSFTPWGWSYAIFCFGNPVVWFIGIGGIAYTVYRFVRQHRYRVAGRSGTWHLFADVWDVTMAFVLIGLLAQFLPWVLVPRGTYIYHYFASVPFLILGTVVMLDRLTYRYPIIRGITLLLLLGAALVLFILLFPYASGVLTPNGWLDFVRDYPWTQQYLYTHDNAFISWLTELMNAFPIFPNVYH